MNEENSKILGVRLKNGEIVRADQVVLTTGTFLRGVIHIGPISYPAGRHRRDSSEVEPASISLSDTIKRLQFRLGRCKTGTPPRLLLDSIDLS